MSAIGDYIHLYAKNYTKYGTERPRGNHTASSSNTSRMNAVLSKRQELIKRMEGYRKAEADTAALEASLNKLIDTLGSGTSTKNDLTGSRTSGDFREILSAILGERFADLANEIDALDFSNINVKPHGAAGSSGIAPIKSRGHYESTGRNYENEIKTKVNQLNTIIKNLEQNLQNIKSDNLSALTVLSQNLDKLIKDDYKWLMQQITSLPGSRGKRSTTEQNLVNQLNDAIEIYAPLFGVNAEKGAFFEDVVPIVGDMIQSLAINGSNQQIRDAVKSISSKANSQVKVQLSDQFFNPGMLSKGFQNIFQTIKYSNDKIDIEMDYRGKPIQASLKNLNLKSNWQSKNITVTSGNSLLQLLQDENSNDFINHYLNLFAEHRAKAEEMKWQGARQQYAQVIKMLILYKGLTGDAFGRDGHTVDTFIVNNNRAGAGQQHVKVISIQSMLAKLIKNEDAFNMGLISISPANVFSINHRFPNGKVEGPYGQTGTQRISNLLQHVHAVKVRASINSSVLMS